MKKHISIYYILVIAFASISLIPTIILSFYIFHNNSINYKNEFNTNIENNLLSLSKMITDFHESNIETLNTFCDSNYFINTLNSSNNTDEIVGMINNFEKNNNEIKNIIIGLENGDYFINAKNRLSKDYDPRQRPWYIKSVNNKNIITVTDAYKSALNVNDYDITYSKTLIDNNTDKILGVVGFDININVLENAIASIRPEKSGFMVVLDKQGNIVCGKEYKLLTSLNKNKDITLTLINNKNNISTVSIDNTNYIYYKNQNPSTSWYLIALVPEVALTSKLYYIKKIAFFTEILLIFISLIAASLFSKLITKPINQIVTNLENNYLGKIEYNCWLPKELHIIINSINNMTLKVKKQKHILQLKNNEIIEQNKEISAQNEEISALYEQTIAMNENLNSLLDEIKEGYKETVISLVNTIEANDEYTKGHCERVTQYALSIANEMNINDNDLSNLEFASLLHDIGKVGIPNNILNKNCNLTEEEYKIIKQHPSIGYKIVKDIKFLQQSAEILYEHHERVDGNGYPNGLIGKDINTLSKILAVADCYDAMTSERPYRKNILTQDKAINELIKNKNTQFDQDVVNAFVKILKSKDI